MHAEEACPFLALLLLVFQAASVKPIPMRQRVVDASPAIVIGTPPRPVKKVHRRHVIAPVKTPKANWSSFEPAIQIAIPVEAMFPPGAVPAGAIARGTFEKGPTAVVKGAPYPATINNESIQTLADDNCIVQTNSGTVSRDSQGRHTSRCCLAGDWQSIRR
jgi:hypothetical protein